MSANGRAPAVSVRRTFFGAASSDAAEPAPRPTAETPTARGRDEADVERARSGDRVAFQRLWERHAALVHAVLISMVPSQEAEDLMQDVAVSAIGAIGRLRRRERFSAWLCTIARNVGRDALKRRRRAACESELEDPAVERPSDTDAIAEEILGLVRRLPEAYREPLVLRLVL
ncbi:MAG: RNA polymerase sigma factor, partial [Planctomycetota bacterium JB042]